MTVTRSVTWLRHAHAFLLGLRGDSRKTFVAHQRAALLIGSPRADGFASTEWPSERGEGTCRGRALADADAEWW